MKDIESISEWKRTDVACEPTLSLADQRMPLFATNECFPGWVRLLRKKIFFILIIKICADFFLFQTSFQLQQTSTTTNTARRIH